MEISNFDNFAYCETVGLANCFKALSELAGNYYVDVEAVGFNDNSGYVYIALESDVTICSLLGRDVEYQARCPMTGEEFFFDNYKDALEKSEALWEAEAKSWEQSAQLIHQAHSNQWASLD